MAWLRGSRLDPPQEERFDPLDAVRSAAERLEAARLARDRAISAARMHHTPLRAIAEAAQLSVTRVKQVSSTHYSGATKPGVTEVDLAVPGAVDRVLALDDVDPFLPRFESEQAFIAADSRRRSGKRMDLSFRIYDADDIEVPWVATWIEETGELYVHKTRDPQERDSPVMATDWDPSMGAQAGPCILLGHLPSWDVVEAGLDSPLHQVIDRPGGLAWVLGRVRRINLLLRAVARSARFNSTSDIIQYIEGLGADEKGMS